MMMMQQLGVNTHPARVQPFSFSIGTMNRALTRQPNFRSDSVRVFGGSSHPELTRLIARKVGSRVGQVVLGRFANRETQVELKENVRGQDIYLVQTAGSRTPNDHLMELLLLINAFRMAAANNIIVIMPFFFYSKGDQKDGYRVPITSKLVASMLRRSGATHLMLLDPHTPQVEGFFDLIVDALKVEPMLCEWVKHHVPNWHKCMVVSPDEGVAKRSASLANDLDLDFAIISNRKKRFELESRRLRAAAAARRRRMKKNLTDDCKIKSSSSVPARPDVTLPQPPLYLDQLDLSEASEQQQQQQQQDAAAVAMMSDGRSGTAELLPDYEPMLPMLPERSDVALRGYASSITSSQDLSEKMDLGQLMMVEPAEKKHTIGHISGNVCGRDVIVVDDMIDTANSIRFALNTLRKAGAASVTVMVTHGVFSGSALKKLSSYGDFLRAVVVTNSIPQKLNLETGLLKDKLHVIDVSGLIAEYVRRHHYRESVSVLGRFMPIKDADFKVGLRGKKVKKKPESLPESLLPVALSTNDDALPRPDVTTVSAEAVGKKEGSPDAMAADPLVAEVPQPDTITASGELDEDEEEDEDVLIGEYDSNEDVDHDEDDQDEYLDGPLLHGDARDAPLYSNLTEAAEAAASRQPGHRQQTVGSGKLRKGFRMASICWDD